MTQFCTVTPSGTATGMIADLDVVWLRGTGVEVGVIGHGARIVAVRAPDRHGRWADIALGLPDAAAYRADRDYLGACVGRYANRISGGSFVLDGVRHRVRCNEPDVALHGGPDAFEHADWEIDARPADPGPATVTLRHTSPDGENGFPGTVEAAVTYRVSGSELAIAHEASTDAPTVLNMTNHTYWNLAGADLSGGGVVDHLFALAASAFLPVDGRLIPAGPPAQVAGTPFDLRTPTPIGARLRGTHPQLLIAHGYDHNFVPDGDPGPDGLRHAALVTDPAGGRTLELRTDQPGMQFYTGNMLNGSLVLRGGVTARQTDAFCLEPQGFPDAPNRPDFPSTALHPGQTYRSRAVFRFGTI